MPLWHLAISISPSGITSHLSVDHWSCCLASLQYWFRRLVSRTTHQLFIGQAYWHIAAPSTQSGVTSHFSVCFQFMLSDFMQFRFAVWPRRLASLRTLQLVIDLAVWPPVAVLVSPSGPTSYVAVGYWIRHLVTLQY